MAKSLQKEILYPHRRYIMSNLLIGRSVKEISEECQLYSFDIPDTATIAAYQKQLKGMFPLFDKQRPDFDALLTMDLYHLVVYYLESDPGQYPLALPMQPIGIEGAFRIIEDPHMRKLITTLSLGNIQDEDIELIINARYNYNYASEDVRMFVHYFADFSQFKYADKQEFIANVQDRHLKKQYSYAMQGDKNMLLWKMGLAPDKSFDAMLRDIGVDCYYNYKEQLNLNDPTEAQKWAGLLLKVEERIGKIDSEDIDKKDLFGSLVFQVQSMKASSNIVAPEDILIDLPTYVNSGGDSRMDIISLDQLESLSNATITTVEEPKESDKAVEERVRGEHPSA